MILSPRTLAFVLVPLLAAASLRAQYTEIEPNNSKTQSDVAISLGGTTTFSGTLSGSDIDYWRVRLHTGTPGLYRYLLAVNSANPDVIGTVRGLFQSTLGIATGTDAIMQTSLSSGSGGYNAVYGFGGGEDFYYAVSSTSGAPASYTITLTRTAFSPLHLGTFGSGNITIDASAAAPIDSEIWVYDSNFHAIPGWGMDDPIGSNTSASLTRGFAPGTYYVAIGRFNMANSLPGAPGESFFNAPVMDFPGVICTSWLQTGTSIPFSVSDCSGPTAVLPANAALTQGFQVLWYEMRVRPVWETNSPVCSYTTNGQDASIFGPVSVAMCAGESARVILETNTLAGMPWEFALTTALPVTPAALGCSGTNAILTANDQVVNVDLFAPGLVLAFGGLFNNAFPGALSLDAYLPAPTPNVCAQMVILDPAHPDGFQLSALNQITVGPAFTPLAAPVVLTGDENVAHVAAGCVTVFGYTFQDIYVDTNGRLSFGFGAADPNPSVAAALVYAPWVGCWMDMYTTGSDQITISSPNTHSLRVQYQCHLKASNLPVSFRIDFDAASGEFTLSGLNGIPSTQVDPELMAMSAGGYGSTDLGMTAFGPGGPYLPLSTTAMIYDQGTTGNLSMSTPVNSIRFSPLKAGPLTGNFRWVGAN